MSEAELIFTALAELSTRQIAEVDQAGDPVVPYIVHCLFHAATPQLLEALKTYQKHLLALIDIGVGFARSIDRAIAFEKQLY